MLQILSQLNLIVAYLLLIPFILLNILLTLARFFAARLTAFTQKYLNLDVPYETSRERTFNIVFTLCWLIIGIYSALQLDNPISLSGFMVFLAFRSGSTLGRRVIYGFHDSKVIKATTEEKQLSSIISLAFKIGLIAEGLFLLAWGILYKVLSISIKLTFGMNVNLFMIILWVGGLIFGVAFGLIRSRIAKGFLLKDEIIIVLLFSGKLVEEKVKSTFKDSFLPKL